MRLSVWRYAMIGSMNNSPFSLANPLYDIATGQNFASDDIQFKPIIDVLELLFGAMAFGNFFINVIDFRTFTYPYNSPSAVHVLGYPPEQISNLNWLTQNIHPDDLPIFMDYGSRSMQYIAGLAPDRKKNFMINHCYRVFHGTKGEYIWLYQQNHMSYIDANGAVVYSISLVTDVTHLVGNQQKPTWAVIERVEGGLSRFHIGSDEGRALKGKNIFTSREKDVLTLLAQGNSAPMIAEKLNISYQTVLTHKKNILMKSKSGNISEAVAYTIQLGYL